MSKSSLKNLKREKSDIENNKMRIKFEDDPSDTETENDDMVTDVSEPSKDANELNVNESPILILSSETSKGETDEDGTYCETSTKKRKKVYTLQSNKKKLRKSASNNDVENTKSLETTHTHNPIVYTTRLEDMAILHKDIKHSNNELLLNKILWESKPVYMAHKKSSEVKRNMSFKLLKNTLKKLQRKQTDEDSAPIIPNDGDNNTTLTDVINQKNITFNAKEKVVLDISQKLNLVIVIKNLFSKTYDIYATDTKGNITDCYFAKSNDIIEHIDQSKFRLTLVMCCWFNRQHRIESIWPRHTYPFSRFLTTKHKCPPDRCTCCCKPREKRSSELIIYKPSDSEVFSYCFSTETDEDLILTALKYKPPEAVKKHFTCYSNEIMLSATRFHFLENVFAAQNNIPIFRSELYEIRNNEIVRFHVDAHAIEGVQCSRCIEMLAMTDFIYHELFVCCQWKKNCFLNAKHKQGHISSSILRFLKKTGSPFMCRVCKDNLSPEINVNNKILHTNLDINIPRVEHTRKSVKPTLFKIGYKAKTDFCSQPTIETPIQISTVTINVRCEQIPELVFQLCNLNMQVATKIVEKYKQMSLTVKGDGKVIASSNSLIQTTSAEEFEIFARILKNIQNHPKLVSLSPGSNINLAIKIVNDNQSDLQIDVASDGNNAGNEPFKRESILEKTLKYGTYNKHNRRLNGKGSDNFDISKQTSTTSLQNVRIKKSFPNDFNTVFKTIEDLDIASNKLGAFDNFSNVIKRSKKCFGDSFKAYVNEQHTENDTEMVIPKITSVFSLQDSTLNSSAKTSINTDFITSIPSNIYKNNVQKGVIVHPALNTPQIGRNVLIYDPTTMQLINFTPDSFPSIPEIPVNNSLTNTSDNSKNTIILKPVDVNKTNSSLAILTPMILCPIQVPQHPNKVISTLPDIVNDISKNNCATDRKNYTVVKDEVDEEVVILDSD